MVDDSRYRTRVYLTASLGGYLVAGNMLLDDAATPATFIVCYDKPNYPMKLVFFGTKNNDLIFSLGEPETTPLQGYNHVAYRYHEQIPITVYAVDKTGLTAVKLLWQAELELRRIAETYPNGSGTLRVLSRTKPGNNYLGGFFLYSVECLLSYTRSSEVIPTVPNVSYGEGFIFECDRLSGGPEGAWTASLGGATATFLVLAGNDYIDFNVTAGAGTSYYYNATNLSLSSDIYTRIRGRYYTDTSDASVVLEFNGGDTQPILTNASSSTFAVFDVAITAAKTIDHVRLHCNNHVGHVYWDFIEIYKGTYILPNCTDLKPPKLTLADANLFPPGSVGNRTQPLGAESAEIQMTCDLDIEPALMTWKRAQTIPATTLAKTDHTNMDILYELHQENATTKLWHWLDYGDGQVKARLVDVSPDYGSEGHKVVLTFREYCHGSKAGETYEQRFGLEL